MPGMQMVIFREAIIAMTILAPRPKRGGTFERRAASNKAMKNIGSSAAQF
jgi:hypothetical protein